MKIGWSDISIGATGYFFRLIPSSPHLDSRGLMAILDNIIKASEPSGELLFKEISFGFSGVSAIAGAIFMRESLPTCILKPDRFPFSAERKISYVFIVQSHDRHVIIFKKLVKGVDSELEKYCMRVSSKALKGAFTQSDNKVLSINAVNSRQSPYSYRTKSVSATNLKKVDGFNPNFNYVLKNFKFADDKGQLTVRLKSSAVAASGSKANISDVARWVENLCKAIGAGRKDEFDYLDSFAFELDFREEAPKAIPISITILSTELEEFLEKEGELAYPTQKDLLRRVDRSAFSWLLDRSLKITYNKISKRYEVFDELNQKLEIAPDLRLKFLKNQVKLESKSLRKIIAISNGDSNEQFNNLEELLNASSWIADLQDPSKFLFGGTFFGREFLRVAPNILDSILKAEPLLKSSFVEKGQPLNGDTQFSPDTLFGFVEGEICRGFDTLVCDDLGDEWADYIGIKGEEIVFIHCKDSTENMRVSDIQNQAGSPLSASKCHVVFGQVVKNIGNLFECDVLKYEKKCANKWSQVYQVQSKDKKKITKIARKRKCKDVSKSLIEDFRPVLSSSNKRLSVVVVVNFLSKKDLLKISKDQSRIKGHVYQLIWFITQIFSELKSMGINFYIHCLN